MTGKKVAYELPDTVLGIGVGRPDPASCCGIIIGLGVGVESIEVGENLPSLIGDASTFAFDSFESFSGVRSRP